MLIFLDIFGIDITAIFSDIVNRFDFLSNIIEGFIRRFRFSFFSALDFLKTIWNKVFKRGLLKLLELYGRLRGFLARVFGPLLRILRRIRDWLDKVYYPRLLKIINMIQRVRQMLTVLRIFNVAWAKRLDERLLRLERKIIEPYTVLRNAVNLVSTYLNLILDPTLILRANPLIAGIIGALGQLVRGIFGIGFSGMVGDGKVLPPPKNAGIVTRADALAIARGVVTHDTGYGQVGDDARKLFLELWHEGAA